MTGVRTITRSTKTRGYMGIVNRADNEWSAFYATEHGFVQMYAEFLESGRSLTVLVFIHNRRRWQRTFDAYYTPTGAARLATKFAQAVAQGKVQP